MVTLELTIQRKFGEGWPIIAEQVRPGLLPTRSEGFLALDEAELLAQITPQSYGTALGQAFFQGSIRDAFARSLAESNDSIRLLLFIEAADLRTLRWERLCAPVAQGDGGGWDFLALNQRTLFSLYLPSQTDRRYPPIGQRDLRALVLIANPLGLADYGLSPFDAAAAAAQVQAALGNIPFDLLASSAAEPIAHTVGPASLEALCRRLTEGQYTLVHVICHGHFDAKSGETSLFLGDQKHYVDRVDGTRLLERLGRLRGRRGLPHLAFLATCQSAAPEAEGALGGLAQRLVRELGMPAVIAMTEKISLETTQLLTGGFYARLQAYGEVDRALVEATIAIANRSDVTVPAIYSRLGGQPLFSQSLDRDLTNAEIDYGLDALKPLLDERAPVMLPRFDQAARTLRRTLQSEPATLGAAERSEHQDALDEIDQLSSKATDLGFKTFSLGQQPSIYDARCPFRGLVAFGSEDSEFFFGRERLVEQLHQRLSQHPFIAILGPSGSGKSSLVLAGLIPKLQQKYPELVVTVMRPGNDPIHSLRTALANQTSHQPPVAGHAPILIVDQFEELFTLCPEEGQRQQFLIDLLAPTNATNYQTIITMRADFWGECASYPTLREQMLAHQLLIAPMDAAELRAAMEQQVRTVGLRFEADLANTILDDVAGEPGAMPLLQHGLRALWQRRYGRWLPAVEYREMGGIRRAIAGSAEAIYSGLSTEDQNRMRALLLRLTRFDEEALPGQQRRDTRRRVVMDDLVTTGDKWPRIADLVRRLANERLLVTSRNERTGQDEVEVAHEALIREWPRLQEWIAADLEGMRMQRQVTDAIAQWQANGEDPSFLYRGRRLRAVLDWARESPGFLNAQEQAFVAASARREQLSTLRRWGMRAALLVVPVLVVFSWMWYSNTGAFRPADMRWLRADIAAGNARDLVWDSSGTLYASFLENPEGAIVISNDQGVTWHHSLLPVSGAGPLAADPYVPGRLYAVGYNATLWMSSDSGVTWQDVSPQDLVLDIAVSSNQDLYVSAGRRRSDLYYSTDRGASWNLLASPSETRIWFLTWANEQLLVGREDGLWSWDAETAWTHLFANEGWVSSAIAHEGQLWFATNNGMYRRLTDGTVELVTAEKFDKLALLAPESAEVVIVAVSETEFRWFPIVGGKSETIGLPQEIDHAQDIHLIRANGSQRNALWIAADTGLYYGNPAEYLVPRKR